MRHCPLGLVPARAGLPTIPRPLAGSFSPRIPVTNRPFLRGLYSVQVSPSSTFYIIKYTPPPDKRAKAQFFSMWEGSPHFTQKFCIIRLSTFICSLFNKLTGKNKSQPLKPKETPILIMHEIKRMSKY